MTNKKQNYKSFLSLKLLFSIFISFGGSSQARTAVQQSPAKALQNVEDYQRT
jgi:hypothetical protein